MHAGLLLEAVASAQLEECTISHCLMEGVRCVRGRVSWGRGSLHAGRRGAWQLLQLSLPLSLNDDAELRSKHNCVTRNLQARCEKYANFGHLQRANTSH